MRFFRSRLVGTQYLRAEDQAWIFSSGERPPHGPRRYSVSVLFADGRIARVGPFCEWGKTRALRVARQMAKDGRAVVDGVTYTLEADEVKEVENADA